MLSKRETLRSEREKRLARYAVTPVTNGVNAVEAALRGSFDLYLLDAVMPVLSGQGACERSRS